MCLEALHQEHSVDQVMIFLSETANAKTRHQPKDLAHAHQFVNTGLTPLDRFALFFQTWVAEKWLHDGPFTH